MPEAEPLLELDGVEAFYGVTRALKGVSLRVGRGEIVALLGANGAGKSTALRCISRLLKPRGGDVRLDGRSLLAVAPEEVVRMGISHVPEGRRVLPRLSVEENLELGAYTRKGGWRTDLDREYARFPVLRQRARQLAGTLSGGEQQMLAIARGMMARPRLLLLDEPSLGLAPKLVMQVMDTLRAIHAEGVSVLLVEQNARLALDLADRGYVLETGSVRLEGRSAALREDPGVVAAYLGGET